MPSIEDTAYPRLKSNPSQKELQELYSPTIEEVHWMKPHVKGDVAKLGLFVLLKTFQRLGYFLPVTEIPEDIVIHIAQKMNLTLVSQNDLQKYHNPGTQKRHHALIREYKNIHFFNDQARKIMTDTMNQVSSTKDDSADFINAAIDELIRQRFELPTFSTLNETAKRLRSQSYHVVYDQVYQSINENDKNKIDSLFQTNDGTVYTPWHHLKQDAKSPTIKHFRELVVQMEWLMAQKVNTTILKSIPSIKVRQMASEAKTLDAARMKKMEPKKRYALALSFVQSQLAHVLDNIGEMMVKRMMSARNKSRDQLQHYQMKNQKRTDLLITTLHDVILAYRSGNQSQDKMEAIEQVIGNRHEEILHDCESHLAYSGDNYFVFVWDNYKSSRSTLFKILNTVSLRSTNQDQGLEDSITFLKTHQNSRKDSLSIVSIEKKGYWKKEITPLLDLSWIPDSWWRWIAPNRKSGCYPEEVNRRHFEACVFTQIMWGLKSGDLYIEGSEKYADYRQQLISWDEYEQKILDFCHKSNLPSTGKDYVKQLRKKFMKIAKKTDASFPYNKQVRIENGEIVIGKSKKRKPSSKLKTLEKYIAQNLVPINVLDMLGDTEHWLNWTRFFKPISKHESRLEDPIERYLTTVFCYGCNLGPVQTARSLGNIDRRQISWVNQRHITTENLDQAIQFIINSYNKFGLPKYWGDGKSASADGTIWALYEQNLLSERHIRYGGYGGIGYYHVSDNYIALFSHFIPCGVWEGLYILDVLMNNNSEIQPEVIHSDTQGQSATIFGLSTLMGIELMPRIRNWKDLKMFRPDKEIRFKHIDDIFTDEIDWDLIEIHYKDMLRVAMSIEVGKITPSTILNKLGTYSKKNKLYQAFRELGRVIRTMFLLKYIADEQLRRTIQTATNKSESFNGFTKWLFFGGEGIITENNRENQRKVIKFNHLVANCLIFYNVFALTQVLHTYRQDGNELDEEVLCELSPYITAHVNRFGKYGIDPNRQPPDLQFDMPIYQVAN
ncbi:Tn3 family transposase (plasmid) [Bacillus mycoides]|uniref:Tn3 family transposase n=1 Tax=Bacillus mycoides TaxID=1405 RepID=UPI001C0233DE|nr:Tn3 family transposase [Bacillus mycoides]QWH75465.1 Tn3 family transposase [Bacillus mycoides]